MTDAARNLTKAYIRSIKENDGITPLEADGNLNDASRDLIAAMHEKHGECWLGLINRHGKQNELPLLWKWDGALVYNFGASFVVPEYDQMLADLIEARHEPHGGYDHHRNVAEVDAIYLRIEVLGGHHLHWS